MSSAIVKSHNYLFRIEVDLGYRMADTSSPRVRRGGIIDTNSSLPHKQYESRFLGNFDQLYRLCILIYRDVCDDVLERFSFLESQSNAEDY